MSIADPFFASANQHAAGIFGDDLECKRPADAEYVTVTATITPERRERRRTNEGMDIVTVRDVIVEGSDLPGGMPRIDMTWRHDGVIYSTDQIADAMGGFSCVTLTRSEKRRSSRTSYTR